MTNSISETDQHIFDQFIDEIETGDLFEREEQVFISLALNLLPIIPDIIMAHHENVLDRIYDLSGVKDADHLNLCILLGSKFEDQHSENTCASSQTTCASLQHTGAMSYTCRRTV